MNIAFNILCGGRVLDDIEVRRNDLVCLDALGARSIPDPTTAGDYCRGFDAEANLRLMLIVNDVRVDMWRRQGDLLEETARIDADGSLVPTDGECKEGMDVTFKGEWGYHPLLVSLANTQEPLWILNREGSRLARARRPPPRRVGRARPARGLPEDLAARRHRLLADRTPRPMGRRRRALRVRLRRHQGLGAAGQRSR